MTTPQTGMTEGGALALKDHSLLRPQRNALFAAIRQQGLDPAEFEFDEQPSDYDRSKTIPKLVHRPSGFSFTFDTRTERIMAGTGYSRRQTGVRTYRRSTRKPGVQEPVEVLTARSWEEQFKFAVEWIDAVKGEFHTPDLWAVLKGERVLREFGSANIGNDPFTPGEVAAVRRALGEVLEFVRTTQHLADDRYAYVAEQLRYLADASERMGRKDWTNLALGVLGNIVVGVALAPEAAREMFRLAGSALSGIIGSSGLLLP